jgi:hypothetical protein
MIESGKDVKIFTGTMDQDTEARYLKEGDYRYLLNGRTSINSQGTFGAVEDVMGNIFVNNPNLPPGINKVIGSYEDIPGQSCIFYVHNSNGFHSIFRWYANRPAAPNGVIELVYQVQNLSNYNVFNPNPLNFRANNLITGVNLFDNINCWTDDFNQPKELDTVKASRNKPTTVRVYLRDPLLFGNTTIVIDSDWPGFISSGSTFAPNTPISNKCDTLATIINTLNGAIVRATSFLNYIEITTLTNGYFYAIVEQLNSAYSPALIQWTALPINIYPYFKASANPLYQQPDLVQWHTNLIKTPLRCAIKAKYVEAFNNLKQLIFANVDPATAIYFAANPLQTLTTIHIGSNNDSPPTYFDTANEWNLSPSVIDTNPTGALIPAGAFYTPLFNDNVECEVYLKVRVDAPSGNVNTPWQFYIKFLDNITATQVIQVFPDYTSQNYDPATWNTQVITLVWKFKSQVFQGRNYHFDTRLLWPIAPATGQTSFEIIDGYFKINSIQQSFLIDTRVPYIFRAKYVFWNYENSVYNAYSVTPKPITYTENAIELDFTDLYLSTYTYITLIKNVVLSYSDDDGLTWYDFKMLEPYQFYHNQKYLFFGNENIRTVPPTEATALYHAVPIQAKSQEFVDSRIFFGAIVEGYSLHQVDYNLSVRYVDLKTQVAYPTVDIFNSAQTTQNFGSYWERGYIGYVGIVYYDDYDRKTFVNLGVNAKLSTEFWSQNLLDYHAAVIDWEINNDPPDWATKYHWVRTKNIRTNDYLEWSPEWSVTDDDYNPVPFTRSVKVTITQSFGSTPYPTIFFMQINGANIIAPNTVLGSNDIDVVASFISGAINGFGAYTANAIGNNVYVQLPLTGLFAFAMSASTGTPSLSYNVTPDYYGTYWCLDFASLEDYNVKTGAKLSFNYVIDDMVAFKNANPSAFSGFYETPIRNVIGNLVYVSVNQNIPTAFFAGAVQVYSKSSGLDNFYYEFGECYDIYTVQTGLGAFRKFHRGQTQDQSLGIPATGTFSYGSGNAWYRGSYDLVYAGQAIFPNIVVQRQTFGDFTAQRSTNNGRINTISDRAQQIRPSTIRFSNRYISNTEIFGANEFELLNENQFNNEYGKINKLQVVNNDILKLIFGNSYQLSIYVSQGVIRQTQEAGNLITLSDQVASNSHLIQRTLGTLNAESVIVNDEADMFGWDENEGIVWVSSGNGLIQISDRGLKSVFRRYAQERLASGGVSETPAVYDLYHDEYIITLAPIINPPNTLKTIDGVTIAYNKQKQGWTSYYSFIPEYYGRVRNQVISFVKGELFLHDRSGTAKNFYGIQYTRELTYVTNKDFPKVRDFKAISINGIGLNDLPTIRVLPFEGYPNGMFSLLTKRFFKTLEGVQYAYFQKDRLTPGMQANPVNAMANGRNLKGQVLEVTLVNNDTTKSSIYSSEILYFYSEHS